MLGVAVRAARTSPLEPIRHRLSTCKENMGVQVERCERLANMDMHLDEAEMSVLFPILNRMKELPTEFRRDHNSLSRRDMQDKEKLLASILAEFPDDMEEHAG